MSETSSAQTQRPISFKVKLQVEPAGEDGDKENHTRPHSGYSWREQFLRLVHEAPHPVPVLCSEPRRFPHFGRRYSESSWESDTTRLTGVTLSESSSLDALDDEVDISERNKTSDHDEIGQISQRPVITSETETVSVTNSIPTNGRSDESGNNKESNEIKTDQVGHRYECENEGQTNEPIPQPSASTSLPQGNSESVAEIKTNEETHQMHQQDTTKTVTSTRSIFSIAINEDPEYWEKFRYSKDYQSSLMIETICNEVFNLKPSPRYKNLEKLSLKNKVRKNEHLKNMKDAADARDLSLQLQENATLVESKNNDDCGNSEGLKEKYKKVENTKENVRSISPRRSINGDDCVDKQAQIKEFNVNDQETAAAITSKKEMGESNVNTLEKEEDKYFQERPWNWKKGSITSTVSSLLSTSTTDEGEKNGDDRRRLERMLMLEGFGQAFHGYLTRRETEDLLRNQGQYLIRQVWKEDGFILSLRFENEIKNYRVVCIGTTTPTASNSNWKSEIELENVLYTYSLEDCRKLYNSLDELTRSGLITLYLDKHCNVDLLIELAQIQTRNDNLLQTPTALTSISRKNSRSGSFLRMVRANSSTSGGGGDAGVDGDRKSNEVSSSKSTSGSGRKSINIALRIHFFEEEIFDGLAKCQVCSHGLWGPTNKGLRCRDCSLVVHESCLDTVRGDCKPDLTSISPFSTDLTTLVKGGLSTTEGSSSTYGPPYILERCITELEVRGGLVTEGIYRIPGSVEEIERLKKLFEKDRINTDLSECQDIHSITGLIKFFLRQLPEPLITQEVFEEFIRGETGEMTAETIQMLVFCLPPAHRITLKYFLDHLNRVTKQRVENKMSAFNLSSVLMPSIICPTNMFEVLDSSTKLLRFLIMCSETIQF